MRSLEQVKNKVYGYIRVSTNRYKSEFVKTMPAVI